MMPNEITAANVGGAGRLAIRSARAARIAQFISEVIRQEFFDFFLIDSAVPKNPLFFKLSENFTR